MIFLYALIGACFYRQRGGGFNPGLGTQFSRIAFWAVPTGVLIGLLTGSWIAGACSGAAAFAGLLFGHGAHQRSTEPMLQDEPVTWDQTELLTIWLWAIADYGRLSYWRKELWHWAGASTTNVVRLVLILVPVAVALGSPMALLCAFVGAFPAYFIGWRLHAMLPHIPGVLDEGAEFGEFVTGAMLWSAIALACG